MAEGFVHKLEILSHPGSVHDAICRRSSHLECSRYGSTAAATAHIGQRPPEQTDVREASDPAADFLP